MTSDIENPDVEMMADYHECKQQQAQAGWDTRRKKAEMARQDVLEEGMRLAADRITEWILERTENLGQVDGSDTLHLVRLSDRTMNVTYAQKRNQLRVQLAGEIRLGAYRKGPGLI